ncbi:MAG: hypothetical protein ACI9U2_002806 [Bradymonadia bacterium]|jgi:hypothetical protein
MRRRRLRKHILLAAGLVALVGCDPQEAGPVEPVGPGPDVPGPEAPGPESPEPEAPGPDAEPEPGPEGEPEPGPGVWTTERVYNAMFPICGMCHGPGASQPSFESLAQFEALVVADPTWIVPGEPDSSGLLDLLAGQGQGAFLEMPPTGAYFDNLDQFAGLPNRDDLAGWIARLNGVPEEQCWDGPGPLIIPRLNRTEYDNAIRHLLAVDVTPAQDFPPDDSSQGLDNISGSLSVSPLLVEKYDLAAFTLAEEVLPDRLGAIVRRSLEGEDMASGTGRAQADFWNMWSNGDLTGDFDVDSPGQYQVRSRVAGGQAGPDVVRYEVLVDGLSLGEFSTAAENPDFETADTGIAELEAGAHTVTIRFTNDYYCPQERFDAGQCAGLGDRNLFIDRMEIEGPVGGGGGLTRFEQRFFADCDGFAPTPECVRAGLNRFARVVWRREVSDDDLDRLWGLVDAEADEPDGIRAGLRQAVHALLLSPNFLLRVEADGAPGEALSGHERATRLAAFLWRSVPDEALLNQARDGGLDTPEMVGEVARAMLADARSAAMIDDLGTQWLHLRDTEAADPEYSLFPDFDEDLRVAMIAESTRVFADVWRGEGSLLDLIDANYTYVNARLAEHYGIEGIEGDAMQRVALPQAGRLGLLTQGAWLTATSHRTRTSPVRRGKWVLEELLCAAPPPPPPNVEGLIEQVDQNLPLRQRMEQHRADPACAACHVNMDPIGFGLEQFDATGAYRLMDAGEVIDPAGLLLGNTPFVDGVSMARAIRQHPNLGPCMLEKIITYSLGRTLAAEEACLVDDIDAAAATAGYRPGAIVESIVQSPLFLNRSAEAGQ